MDQLLVAEILNSNSDEIADLQANIGTLENFIELARQIDALPHISKRFYEASRSIYQATANGRSITDLEGILAKFFGPPVKSAGKPLPRKLRKNSSVKYLGGLQKEQSLFLLHLKTGEFYGALWPWRRNRTKIEIHLGYCSDWITDDDYQQIETLVKRCLSHSAFEKIDTAVGGQIHGISLPSFLQMSEMEKSTFTLRVSSSNRSGKLHLSEGVLIAAETVNASGPQAAYQIISWDDVVIEIAPADESKINEIKQPLMHVLMESLKLKDEKSSTMETPPPLPKPKARLKARPVSHTKEAKRLVRLERAPAPRKPGKMPSFKTLLAIGLGILAVIGAGLVVTMQIVNNHQVADSFEQLLSKADKAETPEAKIALLQDYLLDHAKSPHIQQIQKKIQQAYNELEDRDFEQITLKISNIPVDEAYEKRAIDLYSAFLKKYPDSRHIDSINKSIGEIKNLVDQYYYEELKRAARLDFGDRLKTYRQYLSQFPQGRYRQEVGTLIEEMGQQYFAYLKSEAEQCDKKQLWEQCIKRCDTFIENYKGLSLADEAQQLKSELEESRDLTQLHYQVRAMGSDYIKASQAYTDFLKSHPNSSRKHEIQTELKSLQGQRKTQEKWLTVRDYASNRQKRLIDRIQHLDQYLRKNLSSPYASQAQALMDQLETERKVALQQSQLASKKQEELAKIQREREKQARRQQQVRMLKGRFEALLGDSTRYQSHGDGTFSDKNTGLTWCLLDSFQELGGCLDYKAANQYVRDLHLGGYSDWRLPTASELASIYKQAPFYPGSGAEWYWTSEAYVKGYHSVADVVTSKPETVFEREYRSQNECGSVRAVRP